MLSGVVIAAPSGKPSEDVRMKLFAFGPLPGGGPLMAQPPSPSSKDVDSPVETADLLVECAGSEHDSSS